MKILKKVSIVATVALLAGIIAFSACKKDNTPKGTKAGNELCDCLSKTTQQTQASCLYDWYVRYDNDTDLNLEELVNFVVNISSGDFSIEDFEGFFGSLFKEKAFQQDFTSAMLKCDALWEYFDEE